jgi:hypothetical protein
MIKKLLVFALTSGLAAKIYRAYAGKIRNSLIRPRTGTSVKPTFRKPY